MFFVIFKMIFGCRKANCNGNG